MRFPPSLYASLGSFFVSNLFKGIKKFPLVLMLEPTHRCNLECAGCDRIRLHHEQQYPDLSLSECVQSVLDSRAPVVTVTGGEPFLYPELKELLEELFRMKKYVYLCTNGVLAEHGIGQLKPNPRLTLNFHLDGLEKTHDAITGKPGTFEKAIQGIRAAKALGFRVSTNTSIYKNSDIHELENLFRLLKIMKVDGVLISPAFSYERVQNDIFLSKDEAVKKIRRMAYFFKKFPFMNSPVYIDFLKGGRDMACTPWGNPTRNPLGWKSPCYLITDAYYKSFAELMENTDWERYGTGRDPRCADCMVHSGYEASSMREAFSSPGTLLDLLLWNFKKT